MMRTTSDFDPLKRKILLAYHQDGILDLTAATVVLGFGAFMATGNVVFLVVGPIFATQYVFLKQRITIPRFGYVRFESQEKTLRKNLLLLGLGVLALFAILGLNFFLSRGQRTPDMQSWIQQYHMVPLSGLLFGAPALAAAVFLNLKRFYLYAALAVGLPALGAWLNMETFIPILVNGLIGLSIGIGLLANFIKQYPVDKKAGGDDSE